MASTAQDAPRIASSSSPGQIWPTLRRSFTRWPLVSGGLVILLVLMALLAPVIAPHSPLDSGLRDRNIPPVWYEGGSSEHLLGTDTLGRDMLSRLIYGARVSLSVAAVALISGSIIGTGLGITAGYFRGMTDEVITRLVDIWEGLPFILVALVIALALGSSLTTIIILLALVSWTAFVRQVRGDVLMLRSHQYVESAQVSGASTVRIFIKHLLPGVMSTVLVVATYRVGQLILVEAFLSFLGAGIPPPTAAWGSMIDDGREYLRQAWWVSVFPGIAILITVSALSFFGDWVRDYLDPRLRQLD